MDEEKGRKAYRLGSMLKKDAEGKVFSNEWVWDAGEVTDQKGEPSSVAHAWTGWQECESKKQ